MKTLLLAFILISLGADAVAQDTIFKKNDIVIPAMIKEVNPKHVRFKKFENPDGPDYLLFRSEVAYIKYANGHVDRLRDFKAPPRSERDLLPLPASMDSLGLGRRQLYLGITDPGFGILTVGYEYYFADGLFSARIPLSFGLNMATDDAFKLDDYNSSPIDDRGGFYDPDKIVSLGIELSYFPRGQGMARYFLGPGFDFGIYQYETYRIKPGSTGYPYEYITENDISFYMSAYFKNGILLQPTRKISVMAYAGLGMTSARYKYYDNYSSTGTRAENSLAFLIGLTCGYRF